MSRCSTSLTCPAVDGLVAYVEGLAEFLPRCDDRRTNWPWLMTVRVRRDLLGEGDGAGPNQPVR